MLALNPRLVDTATPPIPEAQAWAAAYGGAAGPLVDLSQAVPGYPPHEAMLDRLARSAGQATTAKYGPILGDTVLREAYAAHVSTLYGDEVSPGEVAITTGCNQAFVVSVLAVAEAGSAVLLPSPWYFNHKMALDMLGIEARPLPCDPDGGFVPRPQVADSLIDERTRAIVLVTPNNPTGAVYPPDVIASFAELCRRKGLALILDETYRDFIVGRPHDLFADRDWRDTLIALYSFSKSYCIPGHRLGAIIGAEPVLAEVTKALDTLQICAPRVAQAPVAWALDGLKDWRDGNLREIDARARAFRGALEGLNGWRIDSIGAYFAYLRHPFRGRRAAEVAKALCEECGVLCLPGSYFGPDQEGHLRVAFANCGADILAGLRPRFAALSQSAMA
jgi:aspartate/methionine/tyrosine aminotransferase